jgi:GNAT superfamily N-acetyltransferase
VTSVRPLDGRDAGLADRLADLVNGVYAVAEDGLWREGVTRTNAADMAELIARGEMAVVERRGEVVGTVHVEDLEDDLAIFGMLAVLAGDRGAGVGRALVAFAEQQAAGRGRRAMRLELHVPRGWDHPSKEFLKGWYDRLGYRVVRRGPLEESYPQLGPRLACPCDLLVYEKRLEGPP